MLQIQKIASTHHVSVFLKSPEARVLPLQLCPHAKFKLVMVNHSDPKKSLEKGAPAVVHHAQRFW